MNGSSQSQVRDALFIIPVHRHRADALPTLRCMRAGGVETLQGGMGVIGAVILRRTFLDNDPRGDLLFNPLFASPSVRNSN